MGKKTDKKCENHCPNCGAGIYDIKWGNMDLGPIPAREGVCKKCSCEFDETYEYMATTFTVGEVKRIPCSYPMSKFYTYKDEVVDGDRTSTTKDCEKCDEENCENSHCLIRGPHEDKFPPKKEKVRADFLWPVEKDSVEEAGYEFANARTEEYRENWWKILLVRASEIEKIDENLEKQE